MKSTGDLTQAGPVKQTEYQSAVGSLMYLAISTRLDIAFAVNNLARFNSSPQKKHWTALKFETSTEVSQGYT